MKLCIVCKQNEATRNTDKCYTCLGREGGKKYKSKFVPDKREFIVKPSDCKKASAHHWLIASPDGHGSPMPAVCKYCGDKREYHAVVEEVPVRVEPRDLLDSILEI